MKQKKLGLFGKLVILVFAVYTAMTLMSLQAQINQRKAENAGLEDRLAAQTITNAALREDIESDNLEETYARIAREKLGLVEPGEIIIINRTP